MSWIVDDAARFERTFTENYGAIAAYLLRRCASREDAEDAATEVFAIAWRRIGELPASPEDRLWLFGVARRVLANQARAGRRRERLWRRLADRSAAAPETSSSASGAVAHALRALSADDRELLTLVAWDGLEVAEIARVLGVSAPVVSRRLYRARARFERALGDAAGAGHEPADMTALAKEPSA
ncbi:RNA polymerase sigma factor [Baekduia sp. Peel2402]|uniref:RNA polymerase sigma factor n=1 Tax=Baekduia sp. Peel2402 TaxID=3458296 RepID=UPI00403EC66C